MKRLFRPIMSAFFVMVLLQSVFALPVYALTTNLTVSGAGTYLTGYYAAGAVGDMNTSDGDTTYLRQSGVGGYNTWTWTNPGLPAGSTINSVTLHVRGYYPSSSNYFYFGFYNGSVWTQDPTPTNLTYAYATYSKTWYTNPAVGGAWTEAQVDAAEFGISASGIGSGANYTYVSVVVDYTSPTVPSVTTSAATSLAATSATLNGSITNNGGATITNYGFVWGTVDQGDPGNSAPADGVGGWTKGWAVGAGTYSPIPYSITRATGATLTHGTTYYFRAAALNSVGWEYGSALSFATFDHSAIAISAASDVVSTTATLQSQLTTSGGDTATEVEFVYAAGTLANYAAVAAAGGHVHVTATGYWGTGSYPFAPITGLTAATTYTFSASSRNTVDAAYGTIVSGVSTFTTESGVYIPTEFKAIPSSTTISLSWVKGVGAAQTSVRYSTGGYPADYNTPTAIYLDTGNSYLLTGLTPGTTYYFSAWGYTAGTYSGTAPTYTNGKITVMSTTLAYNAPSSTPTPNSITVAPSNSQWNQTPDATKASNIPVIGGLITDNATAYGVPLNMMWYFVWMLCSSVIGVIVFNKSNSNLTLSLFVTCFATGAGMVIGLTMMWIIALMLLIGAGFSMFANSY